MKEYDDGRIWYRKKGRILMVGITEKAVEEIGGIKGLSLPMEGEEVFQDDVVGEIEGEKCTFEIITPMDGMMEAVNESLNLEYEVLEEDPLDEGWIFKLRAAKKDDEEEDSEGDEEEEG